MALCDLPGKLQQDLHKPAPSFQNAFLRLVDALTVLCPEICVKSQARYSAFYKDGSFVAYIEPKKDMILFGFFEDFICKTSAPKHLSRDLSKRAWNGSRPLVWLGIDSFAAIDEQTAEAGYLLVLAYHSA